MHQGAASLGPPVFFALLLASNSCFMSGFETKTLTNYLYIGQ